MALYKITWSCKEDIDEGINNPRIDIFEAEDIHSLLQELTEDNFFDQLPEEVEKEDGGWTKYDTPSMEIFIREMKKHTVGDRTSHWW